MDDRLVEFESNFSVLDRYGEDVTANEFITNPAIGRDQQIKELMLILLTPEKSAILIGKPGIGKTAIVEGLAYRMQRGEVPEALQGYTIINIKTASLLGTMPSGESKVQKMIDELKTRDKVILFVDEIHMLIGATDSSSLDFANIFKEGLGRGSIKVIGATTSDEYERYILRDKAFTRRFQKVEVPEPTRDETIQIMMGTLPKFEKQTGRKMKYTSFIQERIMSFLVDITSEYKRVFALGSRYPDVCLTLLKQAFSYTVFDDREYMDIFDIRKAIENSKNIYPDVIKKELPRFDKEFNDILMEEKGMKPVEEWRRDDAPMRYAQESTNSIISNMQNTSNDNFANSGFFKNLESSPQFVDKKSISDMKPVKSIFGKKNSKFSMVGTASVSKGFNEKFNQKKDSKNIDNMLLSSEIGVISKNNDASTNVPFKYSVTAELKPGGTNDLLLGTPISSTLDKKEENYEVEKYRTENAVVKDLDLTSDSLMLDGSFIDKPNSSLFNSNNSSSVNRMNTPIGKNDSIIGSSKSKNNKDSNFDPFGLRTPRKVEEENNSKIVLNNSSNSNNINNIESSFEKKGSSNNNFESIFNQKTSGLSTKTSGFGTKDEYLFGAPMYDTSSSSENSEKSSTNSSSVDIFGQLLSDNMRISNGKIVEDLPNFGAGIKTRPIIGDVVSAGESSGFSNRFDTDYSNRKSTDDLLGLNSFSNNDNLSFNRSSNDDKNFDLKGGKFLQSFGDNNDLTYNNSQSQGMFSDSDDSSGSFINFSDLNAGRIPQNEVNKFISFSSENNRNQANVSSDSSYDDRRYREEDRSKSNVFTDNVLDMVKNRDNRSRDSQFYDDMNDSRRGDSLRDGRYSDNRYDMRRGPYPQDRYSMYDDNGYDDRRYPYPERERPRDDRYPDNGYDMRRGPYPQDRYSMYDDNGYDDRRYPYPERERPRDYRYPDNGYDMRRGPYPQDRYSMYDDNGYNDRRYPYPERERPRDDRYPDNGYDMRRGPYPQDRNLSYDDPGKNLYSERPSDVGYQENKTDMASKNNQQNADLVGSSNSRDAVSTPPVDLNLETGNNKESYFDDFFED